LPGSLVTLSACESGRSQIVGGDETVGLTRAFLAAGASACVVTLWRVSDRVSAEFMPDFYTRLQTLAPAAALRAAQQTLREHYAHPFYWSPFVLVGKQ
jgi:CHAT domain-containing protein